MNLTVLTALLDSDASIEKTGSSFEEERIKGGVKWLIKNSSVLMKAPLNRFTSEHSTKIILTEDFGLYDGLNQGLARVDTEYFMVLGSGDTLTEDAIQTIASAMRGTPGLDAYFFAVNSLRSGRILAPTPSELPVRMACPHPGAVLRTEGVRKIGGFDCRYNIAADYDLISRYVSAFTQVGWSEKPVVNYIGGGISDQKCLEGYLEEELIRSVCERGIQFLSWAHGKLTELNI
jgi:hypothetical protein